MEYIKLNDDMWVGVDEKVPSSRIIVKTELEKQKLDIEARLKEVVEVDDKTLLEWAKANYPITNHDAEREELERINTILASLK